MAKQASTNMLSLAKLLSSINGGLEKYASSFLLNSPIIRTTGASPSFSWYKEIAIILRVEKLAVTFTIGPPWPIFGRQGCYSGGHIKGGATAATAAFPPAKSSEGLGLGSLASHVGLASHGGPACWWSQGRCCPTIADIVLVQLVPSL